ncbi:MAG: hypothetical protein PHH59_15500, partial [Methylovulum sp.]|uniref:GTA baseplate fiber-binding domain-containing protein n=1 Tax=Methylovulum sp. TaxID=1916980 RepID=UPI002604FBD7
MARYDSEEGDGYSPNHAAVPALVNPPVIFIAPSERTAGSGEIWVAVSCNDAEYGGCAVWVSNDTGTYYQIGELQGQSTQGLLVAALPAATGVDTANLLQVDLSMSRGVLEAVSQQTVDRIDSLCYVGGELLAYRDAVPMGAGQYNLGYLRRGMFGSVPGAASGADFALLTGPVFHYRFNKNAVGGDIHFKFQGFNLYGGGLQDLADCVAYSVGVTHDGGIKALLSDIPIYTAGDNISIVDHVISATGGGGGVNIAMNDQITGATATIVGSL